MIILFLKGVKREIKENFFKQCAEIPHKAKPFSGRTSREGRGT
jgi:hypothetical protein